MSFPQLIVRLLKEFNITVFGETMISNVLPAIFKGEIPTFDVDEIDIIASEKTFNQMFVRIASLGYNTSLQSQGVIAIIIEKFRFHINVVPKVYSYGSSAPYGIDIERLVFSRKGGLHLSNLKLEESYTLHEKVSSLVESFGRKEFTVGKIPKAYKSEIIASIIHYLINGWTLRNKDQNIKISEQREFQCEKCGEILDETYLSFECCRTPVCPGCFAQLLNKDHQMVMCPCCGFGIIPWHVPKRFDGSS